MEVRTKLMTQAINGVTRYVVTKLDTSGTAHRTLFDAAQGRYTYATAEEAQERADAFKRDRHCKDMALEVRSCECWPVHFDPKERWFALAECGITV